jgi:putative endonuclease
MTDATAWLYIMANRLNGTIYVGVTSDLVSRIYQHRNGLVAGFTKRYGLKRLVYVEPHESISQAIMREKNVKSWPRAWRVRLIASTNPNWDDLYETILH